MGWFSDIFGGVPGVSEVSNLFSQADDAVTRPIARELKNGGKDIAVTLALGPFGGVYAAGRAMQAQTNKTNRLMMSALEQLRPPTMPVLQAPKAPGTQRNASGGAATGVFSGSPYSTILTTPSGVLPSSALLGKSLLLGS